MRRQALRRLTASLGPTTTAARAPLEGGPAAGQLQELLGSLRRCAGEVQRASPLHSAAAAAQPWAPERRSADAHPHWAPAQQQLQQRCAYSAEAVPNEEQQQQQPTSSSSSSGGGEGEPSVVLSDSAVERLRELQAEAGGAPLALRLLVEGGGCSGFQYEFALEEQEPGPDDRVFERDGARLICDVVSLQLVTGAQVDFESDLMRSAFVVAANPNAASSCGCGSSFVAK